MESTYGYQLVVYQCLRGEGYGWQIQRRHYAGNAADVLRAGVAPSLDAAYKAGRKWLRSSYINFVRR